MPPLNNLQKAMNELLCGRDEESASVQLLLHTSAHAIKVLFHSSAVLPSGAIVLLGLFAFIFAAATYGIAVPSGLFVPGIPRSIAEHDAHHIP